MRFRRKKRKHFHSREEWADYALRVAKSSGGTIQINRYSWNNTLERACIHACKLGLMKGDNSSHWSRYRFTVTENGWAWRLESSHA